MSTTSLIQTAFNAPEHDPVSDPEPPAPPLPDPDPGVFQHEPGEPSEQPAAPAKSSPEKDRA